MRNFKDFCILSFLLIVFWAKVCFAVTIFSDDMTNFPTGWTLSGTAGNYWTQSSAR